ncbi:hypothetical protein STAFG_7340 [Streptomyces afghaniensis 772]|uniref:Metallo-beta-lactamase domain-containing protein n=1 Tax=Streptomyces afghaniensis 772 TaxID=1283301 RepID=S4MJ21_9ACTN|nr:hypothetical protein STAFG_7340 [Streptomyces afghaniensis 772]
MTALGRHPRDVRRIVLTHFHEDHAGGAAEFAALSGAEVLAHRLDAPAVRGEIPGPEPVFEDWERPLHEQALKLLPRGDYARPGRSPNCPAARCWTSAAGRTSCTCQDTRTAASRCISRSTARCSPVTRSPRRLSTAR